MPQSDPFAAYVVKSTTSSADDPFAAYEVGGAASTLYDPKRKPASPEDYYQAPRDVSYGDMLWNAAKSIPSGVADTVKAAYNDQRAEDVSLGPGRVLAPLIRAAGSAALDQAHKAGSAARRVINAPTASGKISAGSELVGHTAGAVLPLIGPSSAAAGEDIGSGDPERIERGGGNAIGLVGSMLAPGAVAKVAPKVAPALATMGEQLASKGRSVARVAGPVVKEIAKTAPLEIAASYFGAPHGAGVVARVLLKQVLDAAKGAKGAASEAVAEVSPNAGGRVVTAKAPTLTQELTDALAETRAPQAPASVTTAPDPSLPPGYTPRSTLPKAKQAKASLSEPRQKPTASPPPNQGPPKRAYFLKSDADIAAAAEPVESFAPTGSIDIADLPAAWKSHTGQDLFPVTGVEAKEITAALRAEIKERGMTVGQAISAVSKNKDIPTKMRAQIIRSFTKGEKG